MQNSQKSPKKRKSKATIHPKKNREMRGKIYPKMISQKAKESENKRQNHPKKSPAIRHRNSPKRKILRAKTVKKAKLGLKKWKMIILLRKRLFSSN